MGKLVEILKTPKRTLQLRNVFPDLFLEVYNIIEDSKEGDEVVGKVLGSERGQEDNFEDEDEADIYAELRDRKYFRYGKSRRGWLTRYRTCRELTNDKIVENMNMDSY